MADGESVTARLARRVSPVWFVLLILVWWILASPRPGAWVAGAGAAVAGMLLHAGLGGRSGARITFKGAALFISYFLIQSLRGGLDVARRAFSPRLPLSPGFLDHPLSLPEGPARTFFVNCVSLLPGTFSASVEGAQVRVHLLVDDGSGGMRLRRLESRVGALFGIEVSA